MTAAWIAIPRPSWLRPLHGRGRFYGFLKRARVFEAEYFGSPYFSVPQTVQIFARHKDSDVRRGVTPGKVSKGDSSIRRRSPWATKLLRLRADRGLYIWPRRSLVATATRAGISACSVVKNPATPVGQGPLSGDLPMASGLPNIIWLGNCPQCR